MHKRHLTLTTSCLHCLFCADIPEHRQHIYGCPLWLYAAAAAAVIVICMRVQPHRPLRQCKTMTKTIRHYYYYFVFYLLLKTAAIAYGFCILYHCSALHVAPCQPHIIRDLLFFVIFLLFYLFKSFLLPLHAQRTVRMVCIRLSNNYIWSRTTQKRREIRPVTNISIIINEPRNVHSFWIAYWRTAVGCNSRAHTHTHQTQLYFGRATAIATMHS